MQVTITFDPTSVVESNDARVLLNKIIGEAQAAPAASTTKASASKDKPADKPKADAPPPVVETPKAAEVDPLDDKPAVVIDRETVRASLKKVQTLDGKDAAVTLLKKYGAASMSELKDEHFAAIYADAEANPKVKAAG